MTTMKAVRFHEYGNPDVLKYEDVVKPQPEAGDVLVKIHAAAVNPVDCKIRSGYLKQMMTYSLPLIPGWDFSGVIEAVGTGVTRFKKGDAVYSRPDIMRNGAFAEYIIVRESEIAHKPKSIDHLHAAAIPLAALTAWQSIFDYANLSAGQRILIHGAAGGVGGYAVQLAKWKGAYVIGTGLAQNHTYLHDLGADEVIDYSKNQFDEVVHDVDVVLDLIGGDTQKRSWQVLKKGGALVSTVGLSAPEDAKTYGVLGLAMVVKPNATQLTEIAKLVDSGNFKINIEKVLPLADAQQAHELSQSGQVRGKIVIKIL